MYILFTYVRVVVEFVSFQDGVYTMRIERVRSLWAWGPLWRWIFLRIKLAGRARRGRGRNNGVEEEEEGEEGSLKSRHRAAEGKGTMGGRKENEGRVTEGKEGAGNARRW